MATYQSFVNENGIACARLALPGDGREWGWTLSGVVFHKFVVGEDGFLRAACRKTTRPHLHRTSEFNTRDEAETVANLPSDSGSMCPRCVAKDDADQAEESTDSESETLPRAAKPYRNRTRELRAAQAKGARIVCATAPHEGREMEYAPRTKRDREPWRMVGGATPYRYSGGECRAEWPEEPAPETGTYEVHVVYRRKLGGEIINRLYPQGCWSSEVAGREVYATSPAEARRKASEICQNRGFVVQLARVAAGPVVPTPVLNKLYSGEPPETSSS